MIRLHAMRAMHQAVQIGLGAALLALACSTAAANSIIAPDTVRAESDGSFNYEWIYVVGQAPLMVAGLGWSNVENTKGALHGDCFCGPSCSGQPGDTIRWNVHGELIDRDRSGRASNWLAPCDAFGESRVTLILPWAATGVDDMSLDSGLRLWSSPNPNRGRTTLYYSLPAEGPVKLSIYDVGGRWIATPLEQVEQAGTHALTWSARRGGKGLDRGVCFARLEFGGRTGTHRFLVLR